MSTAGKRVGDESLKREPWRPFEQISAKVIGAALAVHKELGPGFLESIYHAARRVSLTHRSIPFVSQFPVDVHFEGDVVGRARIDLVVANQVILELKAVENSETFTLCNSNPICGPTLACFLTSTLRH
jgi:GxxExxY protein